MRLAGSAAEQLIGLLLRRLVQVALDEHLDVLEARGLIVRRKFEHAFQQQLRVIEDVTLDADAGQQAHRFHLVAVLQEEGADHLLRGRELPVREQGRRGYHLGGQLFERGDVRRGRGGVLGVARQAVQALQHAPAGGQGVVDVDRAQECLDGLGGLAQHHVAVATFLEEAAEARVHAFEFGEGERALPPRPR